MVTPPPPPTPIAGLAPVSATCSVHTSCCARLQVALQIGEWLYDRAVHDRPPAGQSSVSLPKSQICPPVGPRLINMGGSGPLRVRGGAQPTYSRLNLSTIKNSVAQDNTTARPQAGSRSCLLVAKKAPHMFDGSHRDAVYLLIRDWVAAVAAGGLGKGQAPWCGVRVVSGGHAAGSGVDYEHQSDQSRGDGRRAEDRGGVGEPEPKPEPEPEPEPVTRRRKEACREPWRQRTSKKRLEKYCGQSENRHDMAGLVGYSE